MNAYLAGNGLQSNVIADELIQLWQRAFIKISKVKIVKTLFISGAAGKLEAIYNPVERPKFLAVVCHPHPLYEGTMHNKVVVSTAKTLSALGGAVIRFNFRGVMASEGMYDHGEGEREDVRAAVDFLLAENQTQHSPEHSSPAVPLIVAGFSFGAWAGLRHGATDARANFLIGLGFPMRLYATDELLHCTKPKLIVYGDRDTVNPLPQVFPKFSTVASPVSVEIVRESDHFFTGKLSELNRIVAAWVVRELGLSAADLTENSEE